MTVLATKKNKTSVEINPKTGKPKGKRGGYHGQKSPVIGNNGMMLAEGENKPIMEINIAMMLMPDIDLEDPKQVAARLAEYFELYSMRNMKPTVAGMAMALGHERRWLWALVNDQPYGSNGYIKLNPISTDLIKKAYQVLELSWETYMNSGKINPVAGIFLSKNNFHYRNNIEYTTPKAEDQIDYSAAEIRQRYINSSEQKQLPDSGNDSD